MTDCNEAAQMEINALVVTVGSGGVQTMDTLVGEAVWKENLFSTKGQIITEPGPFTQETS